MATIYVTRLNETKDKNEDIGLLNLEDVMKLNLLIHGIQKHKKFGFV